MQNSRSCIKLHGLYFLLQTIFIGLTTLCKTPTKLEVKMEKDYTTGTKHPTEYKVVSYIHENGTTEIKVPVWDPISRHENSKLFKVIEE